MKKRNLVFLTLFVMMFGSFLFYKSKEANPRYETEQNCGENEEEEKETGVDKQLAMWFASRAFPDPYNLDEKYMNGWRQAQALRNSMQTKGNSVLQSGTWNSLGPNTNIGGRILTLAIDPTNGNILFAGSASGGIWKSVNGGSNWSPVKTDLPTLGVASIIIHPTNGNIIYAGTGEVYRIDTTGSNPNPGNTGNNVWKTRGTYGVGIIRSMDGGLTWSQVLTRSTSQLFAIQTLRFDPANPNIIYACATDGLYRTTDAGITWNKIFDVTYVSDVIINGPSIVCAAGNLGNSVKGIFKSTDNGVTWSKITTGLPSSYQGFIKFGWLPSNVNDVVASIGVSSAATVELYHSINFGNTWTGLASSDHADYQYWCAHDVAINPANSNRLTFAGVNSYQYTISTQTKGSLSASIHSDVHDIQYDPTNSNIMYICSDGGIYKSTTAQMATPSFSPINNGLAATQFYASLGVSKQDPNMIIGGLQDNGVMMFNGVTWNTMGWVGGDGAACAVDPTNDNNMLACRDARSINRSTDGGISGMNVASYWGMVADSRTAFVAPIAYSKSNPAIVYCATDNLHKSVNGGGSWSGNSYSTATNYIEGMRKTAIALAVSPSNQNKLYVSTSSFTQFDNNADGLYYTGIPNVLKTTTGNTPFSNIMGTGANILPNRYVMDFAISNGNDDSVFVAIGGFGTQHIYVTGDGGMNWIPAGVGLPDVPFNSVVIDPVDPRIIYAGGDMGVYVSPNRGINWYDYNTGFWDATQIMDLQFTADNMLVAATHGKGIFKGARFTPVLPVQMISFTGQGFDNINQLKWLVSQQSDVTRYELERKTEGVNFQYLAAIPVSVTTSYRYNDVITGNQSYTYRLKAVDRDGSFQYSGVVTIRRNPIFGLQVFGNPFHRQLDLQLTLNRNSHVNISLYDAAGKLIWKEQVSLQAGLNQYTMQPLDHLPAGSYFVEAVVNGERWKQKVMKK